MAEAVVSSAANWLGTQLINEGNFLHGIEDQVRSVQQEFEYIALYLTEAESGGEGRSEQHHLFENQIREIAFRAEDAVDKYIIQVASSCSIARPNINTIGIEMNSIHNSMQEALARFQNFQNAPFIATREGFNRPRPHRTAMQTYPHTEDAYVVGRKEDVEDLVQRLICCKETWAVAIVGDGGIGKTTLARKIFTDRRVQNFFRAPAWVTISQQWNQRDLLFEILRQTKGISQKEREYIKDWSEQEFVEAIHGYLSQKSYLLVLDDMWEKEAWDCIYPAVSSKGFWGKVIITTRKEDLPSQLVDQNYIIHRPKLLTDKQRWKLFHKIALERRDPRDAADDHVIQVGREMTQKCDGLPLGVVTLAGLLRTKNTSEWEGVSRRFSSILLKVQGPPQHGKSIYQTLTLSYYDLPYYLKPCFLYLALFPEDTEISAKRLTRMWVAEGFVTNHDELVRVNESVEGVADRYLNELIQRCVVQVSASSSTHTGKAKRCRLHGLTRDFCIAKAEEQCFLRVASSTDQLNISTSASTEPRRLSIVESPSEVSLPSHDSRIRSLIRFGDQKELNFKTICKNFKLLRVLILHRVQTCDGHLPKKLGNLRHLRHLALIETNIMTLPKSIGNLSNLLYLEYTATVLHIIEWGGKEKILPNVFWKMKLLRCLYLCGSWRFWPKLKLHTLTNLQTLWGVRGRHSEAEMEKLSQSLKKLRILEILSQSVLDALFRSPCIVSGNLENVWLEWFSGVELKNMERLYEHCQRLRKLLLSGKIGEADCPPIQFPPSLVKLGLYYSELELHDPMVAAGRLGHLKYLDLVVAYSGVEMTCNAGSFPQLETLRMTALNNLEEWRVEKGAMPRLKLLRITRCGKLKRLPEGLKFIRSLQDLDIAEMPRAFCHKLFRRGDQREYEYQAEAAADGGERGEDFHIIQDISHVRFKHLF